MNTERPIGTLKNWFHKQGYGFLTSDSFKSDVYLPEAEVLDNWDGLQQVSFDARQKGKQYHAANLQLVPPAEGEIVSKTPAKGKFPFAPHQSCGQENDITGELRQNKLKLTYAFVRDPHTVGKDYVIEGRKQINRAFAKDLVRVVPCEGLPEHKDQFPSNPRARVVEIVRPIARDAQHICTLVAIDNQFEDKGLQSLAEHLFLKAIPLEPGISQILIPKKSIDPQFNLKLDVPLDGGLFWPVKITSWKHTSYFPKGEIVGKTWGKCGDIETEIKRHLDKEKLLDHTKPFSDEVIKEAKRVVQEYNDDWGVDRVDLRKERVFSIDPATAKDLDDALSIREFEYEKRQYVEVGVHIADVSHFVREGSKLDEVAKERCTSVYMPGKVLPMLPHLLSDEVCSLSAASHNLCFSCVFTLDKEEGRLSKLHATRYFKSVTRSAVGLSYDQVQHLYDGLPFTENDDEVTPELLKTPKINHGHTWEDVQKDLWILLDIAGKTRKRRMDSGALVMSRHKMNFVVAPAKADQKASVIKRAEGPVRMTVEADSSSHWVIEEMMLMANKLVARKIEASPLQDISVLRNHPPPGGQKWQPFVESLVNAVGVGMDARTAKEMTAALEETREKHGAFLVNVIEMMSLVNGFKAATYLVPSLKAWEGKKDAEGGELTFPGTHHFALNFLHYTHFTSPIRRYADIMVHRVLYHLLNLEALDKESEGDLAVFTSRLSKLIDGDAPKNQQLLCEKCNDKNRASKMFQLELDNTLHMIHTRGTKRLLYVMGAVSTLKNGVTKVFIPDIGKEQQFVNVTQGELADNVKNKMFEVVDSIPDFPTTINGKLAVPKEGDEVDPEGLEPTYYLDEEEELVAKYVAQPKGERRERSMTPKEEKAANLESITLTFESGDICLKMYDTVPLWMGVLDEKPMVWFVFPLPPDHPEAVRMWREAGKEGL